MAVWNPWHGCKKISPGCMNCYVYRRDAEFGKDSSIVTRTASFDLPVKRDRKREYKLQPERECVYTCMTSDFFLEEADAWRSKAWEMIRERSDLQFVIITKRIHRFDVGLPEDWRDGYNNVTICCTCENQNLADYRLPIFMELPIKHRMIIHEPMLEPINIRNYLSMEKIEQVTCGGESGNAARICDFDWILSTMQQCMEYDVPFWFKQTGSKFKKGNRVYTIERKNQMRQAEKAGVDYKG
jgi:protein gp37